MNYFITAIGTDSGKTVASAILTEMLQADYWKPVQAGYPRDTETVQKLVSNPKSRFHPEGCLLKTPASPHAAAALEGISLTARQLVPPHTDRDLVMEGAGGILVPLNEDEVVLDILNYIPARLILVANLYLGSINHTLLTAEVLKSRGIPVEGLIFNGLPNTESESVILKKTGYRRLLQILPESSIDKKTISKYAKKLQTCWE